MKKLIVIAGLILASVFASCEKYEDEIIYEIDDNDIATTTTFANSGKLAKTGTATFTLQIEDLPQIEIFGHQTNSSGKFIFSFVDQGKLEELQNLLDIPDFDNLDYDSAQFEFYLSRNANRTYINLFFRKEGKTVAWYGFDSTPSTIELNEGETEDSVNSYFAFGTFETAQHYGVNYGIPMKFHAAVKVDFIGPYIDEVLEKQGITAYWVKGYEHIMKYVVTLDEVEEYVENYPTELSKKDALDQIKYLRENQIMFDPNVDPMYKEFSRYQNNYSTNSRYIILKLPETHVLGTIYKGPYWDDVCDLLQFDGGMYNDIDDYTQGIYAYELSDCGWGPRYVTSNIWVIRIEPRSLRYENIVHDFSTLGMLPYSNPTIGIEGRNIYHGEWDFDKFIPFKNNIPDQVVENNSNGPVISNLEFTTTRHNLGESHIPGHDEHVIEVFMTGDNLPDNLEATADFYFGENAYDPGAYSGAATFVQVDGGYVAQYRYYDKTDDLDWIIKVNVFGQTYEVDLD